MKQKYLLLLIITSIEINLTKGDVFTSMADVSKLIKTEGEMIRTVENYITAQEERLQKLKRFVVNIILLYQYWYRLNFILHIL